MLVSMSRIFSIYRSMCLENRNTNPNLPIGPMHYDYDNMIIPTYSLTQGRRKVQKSEEARIMASAGARAYSRGLGACPPWGPGRLGG